MRDLPITSKTDSKLTYPKEVSKQHSLFQLLVLYLLPGACILAVALIAAPLIIRAGFPGNLALLLSALLIGTPLRLGYLLYQGKKLYGVFTLRGIVLYWGSMPWWQYLLILFPIMAYAIALEVLLSPASNFLQTHVFWWLPTSLFSDGTEAPVVTTAIMITALLNVFIDGIAVPFVEELYYRGYLLPRMSRFGWFAPAINALLFAFGHFWQPYNYLLIFLLMLPVVYLVYWKRNIKISILVHCTANTLGAVLTLIPLLLGH